MTDGSLNLVSGLYFNTNRSCF